VDIADFVNNSTSTATVTGVSLVTPSTYDVTISGGDLAGFNGTVNLNLSGTPFITDLAGNALPAGEPTPAANDQTYTVDNIAPSVEWKLPVGDGQRYYVNNQSIQLEVNANDIVGMFMIVFRRWDYDHLLWIEFGRVYNPPYHFDFDTSVLLPKDNEIRAYAYDAANNSSSKRILLYHTIQIFLPLILH